MKGRKTTFCLNMEAGRDEEGEDSCLVSIWKQIGMKGGRQLPACSVNIYTRQTNQYSTQAAGNPGYLKQLVTFQPPPLSRRQGNSLTVYRPHTRIPMYSRQCIECFLLPTVQNICLCCGCDWPNAVCRFWCRPVKQRQGGVGSQNLGGYKQIFPGIAAHFVSWLGGLACCKVVLLQPPCIHYTLHYLQLRRALFK